jgi:hypothetical protein
LAISFWLLALGFWLLAFGFWLLAFGFWLLAFGFWPVIAWAMVEGLVRKVSAKNGTDWKSRVLSCTNSQLLLFKKYARVALPQGVEFPGSLKN